MKNHNKVNGIIKLIREGEFGFIWKAFLRRMRSEEIAFGFKRDLRKDITKPRSLIPINTRISIESDDLFFKENVHNGLINRFQTCYVATTKDSKPCLRIWLIDSSQNNKIKNLWKGRLPELKKDEVLFENVFTVPKYRGIGIFPAAIHQITEKSNALGANYAISFGEVGNLNTSRSFTYAGYSPYILRTEKWFFFRRSISFKEIPDELLKTYMKNNAAYKPKPLKINS